MKRCTAGDSPHAHIADTDGNAQPAPRLLSSAVRIAALASTYRWRIGIGILLVMLGSAFSLMFPVGVARVIDVATRSGQLAVLHRFAFGLLLVFLGMVALNITGTYLLKSTGERLVLDLRRRLFRHLHTLDLEFFNRQRLGDLASRLSVDATVVRNAVTDTAVGVVTQSMMLIGSAAVMLAMNWRLAFLVLALAPATALLSRFFGPKLQRISTGIQGETAASLAVASESMAGIAVVKALSRSEYEAQRYGVHVDRLQTMTMHSVRMTAWFAGLVSLMTSLLTVGIFWYGGMQVFSRQITAGQLVAFLFYAQNISQSFSVFAQLYGNLNVAVGASSRIFQLLSIEPTIRESPLAAVPEQVLGHVSLENVGFEYEAGHKVLSGVELTIAPGQILALAGKSGSGKTTIAHLLSRFYDPTQGRLLFDGRDIRTLSLAWLREQIALVSQDVFLFGASIRENIRYGRLDATDREVEEAARAAAAHDFIAALPGGYDVEIGERGVLLSGGQRQRLALARVFLRRPSLVILDEATSGVDSGTERCIQLAIQRWNQEEGVAMLIIAHRQSTMRMAHRTVLLEDGRIIEQGTYDELLARSGTFSELVRGVEEDCASTELLPAA